MNFEFNEKMMVNATRLENETLAPEFESYLTNVITHLVNLIINSLNDLKPLQRQIKHAICEYLSLNITKMPWLHTRILTDVNYARIFTKLFSTKESTSCDCDTFISQLDLYKISKNKVAEIYLMSEGLTDVCTLF